MTAINELRSVRSLRRRGTRTDDRAAAGFLLPWGIGLLVITIGPMLASLYLSFTKFNLLQPPVWIGLDNYTRMFADPRLLNSLGVTFGYVFVSVPLQLALALALAMLLDKGMRGLAFYRSVVLPAVAAGRQRGHRHPVEAAVRRGRAVQPVPGLLRHRGPGLDLRTRTPRWAR